MKVFKYNFSLAKNVSQKEEISAKMKRRIVNTGLQKATARIKDTKTT